MKAKTIAVVAVCIVVLTTPVIAFDQTGHDNEGFEYETPITVIQSAITTDRTQTNPYRGNYSYEMEVNDGTQIQRTAEIRSNYDNGTIADSEDFNVTFKFNASTENEDNIAQGDMGFLIMNDSNERLIFARIVEHDDLNQDWNLRIQGTLVETKENNDRFNFDWFQWQTLQLEGNSSHVTVTLLNGSTVVSTITTNRTGTFNETESQFGLLANTGGSRIHLYTDEITGLTLGPKDVDDIDLVIERNYMEHGSSQEYTVLKNDSGTITDITDDSNLTVTSANADALSVDNTTQTLQATSNESIADRVEITAEYQGFTDTENVTVASLSVENLEILPDAITRVSALFGNVPNADGDRPGGTQLTMQVLLVATMVGVAATVAASAFAGIGAMTIVLAMGWFQGWVGDGVMLGAVFTGLFIGLNLATNVDYSIRR